MISFEPKTTFDSVLKTQHLADVVSSFSDPNFFDEVALYSRYKQVEFLKQFGDVNQQLIELSLDYLDRVKSETPTTGAERFIAITVICDDVEEYIVPSIFVCNSRARTRLKKLRLSAPTRGLGKRVVGFLKSAKRDTAFSILEDRNTVPEEVRVFISYKSPPQGFVSLEAFADGIAARH